MKKENCGNFKYFEMLVSKLTILLSTSLIINIPAKND